MNLARNSLGRWGGDFVAMMPDDLAVVLGDDPIAYLPFGAIEWHNRHLPFDTDMQVALGLARRLAQRTGGVVFPCNPWATACTFVGKGPYPFPDAYGTMALFDHDLHTRLVRAIVTAVIDNGFKRLVLVPGHVGGQDCETLESVAAWVNESWQASALFVHPYLHTRGDHAGHFETLMMLGLAPHLVQPQRGYIPCPFGIDLNGNENEAAGRQKIDTLIDALASVIEARWPQPHSITGNLT
jgi:creatinine amidohydrolase